MGNFAKPFEARIDFLHQGRKNLPSELSKFTYATYLSPIWGHQGFNDDKPARNSVSLGFAIIYLLSFALTYPSNIYAYLSDKGIDRVVGAAHNTIRVSHTISFLVFLS